MQTTPNIITERQSARTALRAPRVLLLEPDDCAREIAAHLCAEDMEVFVADSGAMAARRLHSGPADLAIVQVDLPEGSGYAVADALRADGVLSSHCHVIAISESAEPDDRLRALRRGCVDFLALPLYYPELHARVELALSRADETRVERSRSIEVAGGLTIDVRAMVVKVHGQVLTLSAKEWDLLLVLAGDPDRVMTKAELMVGVWSYEGGTTRTLDSHACRLRLKLAAAGGSYVHNRWGVGYRLTAPSPFTA